MIVDPPTPFAPVGELFKFALEMRALPNPTPEQKDALAEVEAHIRERGFDPDTFDPLPE